MRRSEARTDPRSDVRGTSGTAAWLNVDNAARSEGRSRASQGLGRAAQVGLPLAGGAQARVEREHGVDGDVSAVNDIERLQDAVVAKFEILGGQAAQRFAAAGDEHVHADGDGAGGETLCGKGTRQQDARQNCREDRPSSHRTGV